MILRESPLRIAVVLILGLAVSEAQNARSYDTSDWIPITKPCADCQQDGQVAVDKRATGRVLNLPEIPRGKSFFPEEGDSRKARQAASDQQYLQETIQYRAPVHQQKNVEITPAQLQQYYVTQGPLQPYPQGQILLKQNYPNLPVPQQFLLQQSQYLLQQNPQKKTNNATAYNPLGIGVQTINHELLGGRDNAVYKQIDLTSTTPKSEENQNVQLLYVPVEQLQNKQQIHHRPNTRASPTYDRHKQQQLVSIEKDFIQQALEAHKLQQQLQAYPSHALPIYTSTLPPTTLKPVSRKRIPHQPPLAVYMNGNKDAEVFDVLNVLKNSKSIEVQDAVGPNSPEIFVGPATLDIPDGYAKFDLPYLSSLDSNRVERKVDQPPFFVAPLNYKTPNGYSKIPLPSPHVGSVVVSTKHAPENPEFTVILDDAQQNFNQYVRTTTASPTANEQFAQFFANQDTTTQYYVRKQPTRPAGRQRGRTTQPIQEPVAQLQNAYAEIHDVSEIHTTLPPSANNQVYPDVSPASQVRQKQQTSPHSFYPQQYQDTFSSTPKPKNFYGEVDDLPNISSTPVLRPQQDTQPRIQDIFSIIPPSNVNAQHKENGFDLGQFLPVQKSAEDYRKFEQLFQNAFLPSPNLNQVENTYHNQAKVAPKPTDQASVTTHEQTEGKYTVLEEFSINPKTTTPNQLNQPIREPVIKSEEEPKPAYADGGYRDETIQRPSQSSENYYQQEDYQPQLPQVLPGLINELQDQSVRQLLSPALLAPTTTTEKATEQEYYTQNPVTRPDYDYAYQTLTTTQAPPTTTVAPQIETTTAKRTRGRGNSRFNLRTSTTSTPRRNSHRARTQHPSRSRYATTHPPVTSQITTERSPTRQRFKTRGRPLPKNEDYAHPETTTSPLPSLQQPNSYYELEQAKSPQFIAKSKTLSPEEEYLIKKYNLAYSVAGENQNVPPSQNIPIVQDVNVHLTHPITEVTTYQPQSIPVYNPPETRTTEHTRVRGRFRGKSKVVTTTTTTAAPTTITTTPTTPRVEVKVASGNEEFYGFFRKPSYSTEPNYSEAEPHYNEAGPNYNGAELNYREPQASYREPLYSPSYVSSTIQPPANHVSSDDKPADVVIQNPVQFIGEIRPKFHSTTTESPTTAKYYISTTTTPPPKKRIRGRIRIPSRRVTSAEITTHATEAQTDLDVRTEVITTTRRNVVQRTRGRGRAQFRLPEKLAKAETGDDDVEGGNYPRPFTKPTSTERQVFQIAIDPAYDDQEEDQVPLASIHRPKIVPANDIPTDDRIFMTTTITADFEATTLPPQVGESAKGRKRGYWKLVKQKPVDEFEAAESQNVGVVSANSFVEAETKVTTEKTTTDFFDSIYQMFGLTTAANATETTSVAPHEEEVTESTSLLTPTETDEIIAVTQPMVSVKTSTSTEISHETEICYKGVCVKSKDTD